MKTPRQFWQNMFMEERYFGRDVLIYFGGIFIIAVIAVILIIALFYFCVI